MVPTGKIPISYNTSRDGQPVPEFTHSHCKRIFFLITYWHFVCCNLWSLPLSMQFIIQWSIARLQKMLYTGLCLKIWAPRVQGWKVHMRSTAYAPLTVDLSPSFKVWLILYNFDTVYRAKHSEGMWKSWCPLYSLPTELKYIPVTKLPQQLGCINSEFNSHQFKRKEVMYHKGQDSYSRNNVVFWFLFFGQLHVF